MKYVPKAISRTVSRTALRTQKNSPTILFVVGVTGAVAATVLACRATLRAKESVDNTNLELAKSEDRFLKQQISDAAWVSEKRSIVVHGAIDLGRLYGPSVAVGLVSIACLTKSHRQLTQRNAALTTAYVGLQQFLESYRGRVRKEIGEEKERDLYQGTTAVTKVDKDGKKTVYRSAPDSMSPYAVIWDENSEVWNDSGVYNLHYIKIRQELLTSKLRANGHLFLNEVYDTFDIPPTATGQICGWFVGHPDSDDFVDIQFTETNDFHGSIMLDFNAAGDVYRMLDEIKRPRELGRR